MFRSEADNKHRFVFMIKKKLLVVGGGYAEIPLIRAGKSLGYHVVTTGNKANDIGHLYSDEFHLVDFSDREAVLSLSKKLDISAICSSCNDFSALSSAFVAEVLNLPGHDSLSTSELLHHKDKYRAFALKNNICSPKAEGFSILEDALLSINSWRYPLMVKPVDLTGGKGVLKVDSIQEAASALKRAFLVSKAGRVVVEEFIAGSRHGFSVILKNKKVHFYFSDNEHYYLNQYLVSAASSPSIIPFSAELKLCEYSEQIASTLELVDGIFHIQFIMREGEPIIIEICRRAPGDLYIQLVEMSTGIEYSKLILLPFVGEMLPKLVRKEKVGFYSRHCIMSGKSGVVKGVTYDKSILSNIVDKFVWWNKGDVIDDFLTTKLGIIFLKFDSMSEMLKKTEQLSELIKVEV